MLIAKDHSCVCGTALCSDTAASVCYTIPAIDNSIRKTVLRHRFGRKVMGSHVHSWATVPAQHMSAQTDREFVKAPYAYLWKINQAIKSC